MRLRIAASPLLLAVASAVLLGGCSSGEIRAPLPAWVHAPRSYKHAQRGMEYFVGTGAPQQTRVVAAHSAVESAHSHIAGYIGEMIAVKWQTSPGTKELPGGQSVGSVVEECSRKTLATRKVRLGKAVETYLERVRVRRFGKTIQMRRAYQLHGVTPSALANIARSAAACLVEEMRDEEDAGRKAQLKKLGTMLRVVSAKDFTF